MVGEKIIFSMEGVSKIFPPSKQVLKNIWLSFFYGASGTEAPSKAVWTGLGIDNSHAVEL